MSRDLAKAHDLQSVMNSAGWRVVTEIMDAIAEEFSAEAMDCDDESKIIGLQREARAARRFIKKFNSRVSAGTRIEDAADDFQPVSF